MTMKKDEWFHDATSMEKFFSKREGAKDYTYDNRRIKNSKMAA
jgi:hypothetical protein